MGLILGVAGRMLVPMKRGSCMVSKPTAQPAGTKAKAKPTAPDPVVVDAKHYKVELENERVLHIKYGPHEKSAMHSHPALIAVFVTDGHSPFMYPDGKTEEVKARAGQVVYFPALDHPRIVSTSGLSRKGGRMSDGSVCTDPAQALSLCPRSSAAGWGEALSGFS